jgi:hypothetical protein
MKNLKPNDQRLPPSTPMNIKNCLFFYLMNLLILDDQKLLPSTPMNIKNCLPFYLMNLLR